MFDFIKNILITTLLICSLDAAADLMTYPYLYRSAYFLGRGDTGIATADNEDAIFYNPAGIAVGTGIYKKIVLESIQLELSKGITDVAQQISIQKKSPVETLRREIGSPQHLGANFFSGIILRKAAIGGFGHSDTTTMLAKDPDKGAIESVWAQTTNDGGITFSLASNLFSKSTYIGFTGKFMKRAQARFVVNASESSLSSPGDDPGRYYMLGTGGGGDLGLLYRREGRVEGSLGLTVQDIGNTVFVPDEPTKLSADERALKDVQQTINFGAAIIPGTKLSKFKLLFDFRDIADQLKLSPYKRVHIGTELTVRDVLGFTAGLNQGFPTVGTYLDLRFLRIDLGAYSESAGKTAASVADTRLFFRLMTAL